MPYKIMSFDIEASSSHGDFPVPIKSYKKLATNIVDYFVKLEDVTSKEKCKEKGKEKEKNSLEQKGKEIR